MRRALVIAASLVLLVACNGDTEPVRPDPEPAPAQTEATPEPDATETEVEDDGSGEERVTIQVWFMDGAHERESHLLLHHVTIPATEAIGRAAIEQLLRGVPGPLVETDNAWSAIGEGTELLGLTIEDGTATVNFNDRFHDSGLGSTYDGVQVHQVVYTLTQFPTVKRVLFEVEGERVGTKSNPLGGHGIILEGAQTRKGGEHLLPPIVVESPYPGETVDTTFTMAGIANVFEATVSYRIVDADGKKVQEGFTTATCGTGCWGTFQEPIDYKGIDTYGILQVFESSAEDGSPLHMVEVPLDFGGP